ncbi:lysozyme [Allomesorhizobium camelthorni]|uniref:Lysozyme n=1 Tax=Allomesorhizobium camelthorni TaxID=475069 RepID=A0A6G4W9Z7_9HYPH|nr:lysozyme [Mesorhizobium camelthorni]NGO51602.1 lysozyme [Mesorhizobium camelthorni]
MNRVDYDVAMEVAAHEALIRQAYKDSVGVLTWCVGMTKATGHAVSRYVGKPQTVQHCMNVYVWALTNYAAGVNRAFAGHKLTKAQFAAALSFHWNTGAIERASWVKLFKAGDIAGAKKAFMNWVTPKEITGRRIKERDLFFSGKWSNNGTMTEYTRLTAKMTPVWSSAKRINVSKELRAAFASPVEPVLDRKPNPGSKPLAPTLSPAKRTLFAIIADLLRAIFGRK